MFNRYLTYYPAAVQFIILCVLLLMGLLAGGYFSTTMIHQVIGLSSEEVQKLTSFNEVTTKNLRWILPLTNSIILMIPALLFAYLAYPKPMGYLGINQKNSIWFILIPLLWYAVSIPFSSWLEVWNADLKWVQQIEAANKHLEKLSSALLNLHGRYDLWLNLFFLAFLPAVVEEIFFRGCLQQLFLNWMNKRQGLALILVAVIFSAFHMEMSAFFPRLFLGFLLGLIYYFSGNLWNSILIHFINNAVIVVLYSLSAQGKINKDLLEQPNFSIVWVIMSGLLCLGVGYGLYRKRRPLEVYKLVDESNEKNKEL